jgi:hypothetical protein
MANYLIMIYVNEAALAGADAAMVDDVNRRHGEFAQANGPALRGGARLHGSDSATSIRTASDGGSSVTDGAFAETKEVLGGFYIIEAIDLDAALAIAKQVPAPFGGVEVRPIMPS